jgi:soluble lytic murein transglycosylase-like protein
VTTQQIQSLVDAASARYNLPAGLLQSVAKVESNYDPNAVSPAGAQGVMQLMPATAAGLNVADPFDPVQNIDGGARLLSQLLSDYNGNVTLAVAAYNAGPGAVSKYGGVPPYPETQNYVSQVLAGADLQSADYSPSGSSDISGGNMAADATGLNSVDFTDPATWLVIGAIGLGALLLSDRL